VAGSTIAAGFDNLFDCASTSSTEMVANPGVCPGMFSMPAMPTLPRLKVVYGGRRRRHFLGVPAHNVRVKLAGGFGVAGHQFVPAELFLWG